MKLLAAGGLSYKRARIVSGKISAIISECRCAVANVRHERGLLERAPRLWLSGGESWSSMFGSIMPWTNDRLGAGSPRSTNCVQTVLSPSGSTSGGNATRRRVARKRWSERTGSSVLELPLLRGVLELLCYCDWTNPFLAENNSWRTNPRPAGCTET
jgi:hypothetical protein